MAGGRIEEQKKEIKILGEDLATILTGAGPLYSHRSGMAANAVAFALPPLAFGIFFIFLRRLRRFSEDSAYARGYFALSRARKRLLEAATEPEPAEALGKALTGFLADKLDCNEAGLTSQDVRSLLEERCMAADLIEAVVKVLRACERAQYAGTRLSAEECNALTRAAEAAMDRLDAGLRGGRK